MPEVGLLREDTMKALDSQTLPLHLIIETSVQHGVQLVTCSTTNLIWFLLCVDIIAGFVLRSSDTDS